MKNILWTLALACVCIAVSFGFIYSTSHQTNVVHIYPSENTVVTGNIDVGDRTTILGVEGIMDASYGRLAHFDKPFVLRGKHVRKFQATISYRTDGTCSPQALMVLSVNGLEAYRTITKLTVLNTATTVFVNYDFSEPVGSGKANLHVEADGGCKSDWEIQGVMITSH